MLAALISRVRALRAGPAPAPLPALERPAPIEGADIADFDTCPRENRRTPHAMRADGSRRCFRCGHETPGQDS
ncbi:hypothetical protein AQJ30_15860 [Streptomyces longwoodensis]|uniref:Uncharacterized protein n=1 Tax=Streptomyces longwoodensis TaxID=68231 RepID=A0A101QX52_9ACTN|nr:hypothetical protein [Streptomyces longwoodensis]KUN37756.1 hypothetical protein AQJ30_15860 [Streptomyces longwoodensis]